MRLSSLQKYILKRGYYWRGKFNRSQLIDFYSNGKKVPKKEDQVNIITKSVERLIDRGLFTGYGVRTTEKWFIREIKITKVGLKVAKGLMGRQQKLKI